MSLRNSSGQVYENKISEMNAKILMQKKKKKLLPSGTLPH